MSKQLSGRQNHLEQLNEQYKTLKAQIEALGYVVHGSIVRRTKRCGNPNCRCQNDKKLEHGPYHQWTIKIRAKTVTKILSPIEADLYSELIANGRMLTKLIAKMYKLSNQAASLMLKDKINRE